MSDKQKSEQHDEQIEDLDVEQSEAEEVKGGARKAGGKQQEYFKVEFQDIQISSY